MKLTVVSDLHINAYGPHKAIDFSDWEDVVVIAGDTADGVERAAEFINAVRSSGRIVFAIDGNHEHYLNREKAQSIETTTGNFYNQIGQHFTVAEVFGFFFYGTNGWYDPSADYLFWGQTLNDYVRVGDVWDQARSAATWLDECLKRATWPTIVVTHTAPHPDLLVNRPNDSIWNRCNAFFHNRFMPAVMREHRDKIAVWISGHTHFGFDRAVEGVRCVCNPRGYPGENPNWKPLTIEV